MEDSTIGRRAACAEHMVPVLAVHEKGVRIGDPLTGARETSKEEFLREWLKRGIYVRPSPRAARISSITLCFSA